MDTKVRHHLGELKAPPSWRTIDFVSDLHLQATSTQTFSAFLHYLSHTLADAVVILGDLFEVWIGDDCLDDSNSFESECATALKAFTASRAIYFMHGNRDFLVGARFSNATHVGLLADPCVLTFAEQNWLLSHGDAMCLADTDYMAFRALVHSPQWQAEFLAKSLAERLGIANGIRKKSQTRKQSMLSWADIDSAMACEWLHLAHADTLIHGHTHRPAVHALYGAGCCHHRVVLSDWDASANPARVQVLRLTFDGLTRVNL
ncbi:MAG: UDP-2,3-diacylglucosamine diphosphatase [Burkholderiaceae bacterium]|nr:UDP-2,3-diacylglucosamine diphosphatase [Burkholderiaceae bacterium]